MQNVFSPFPGSRREFWLTLIGSGLLRLLSLTLRVRVQNPEFLQEQATGEPFILAFWHNRLLLIPIIWNRFFFRRRPRQGMALTSTSRDGELIAHFLQRFGIGSVRGSATRRGTAALRELARLLKHGHDVAITPDGSRGPLYEVKGGLVVLAQISGRPVLPISWDCSRAWHLKTWDEFIVPKPFSSVRVRVGALHFVGGNHSPDGFEQERRSCEQALMTLVQAEIAEIPDGWSAEEGAQLKSQQPWRRSEHPCHFDG